MDIMLTSLRLAPYLAMGLLLIGLLWYRGNAIDAEAARDKARAELALAVAANEENQKTIDIMAERDRRKDVLLGEIFKQVEAINKNTADAAQGIVDLEKANEDVRKYLGDRVPPSLGLQLDK